MEDVARRETSPYEKLLDQYVCILDFIWVNGEENISSREADIRLWASDFAAAMGVPPRERDALFARYDLAYDAAKMTVDDYQDELSLLPLRILAEQQYPLMEKLDPYSVGKALDIASGHGSALHGDECIAHYPETGESADTCQTSYQCPARRAATLAFELAEHVIVHEHVASAERNATEYANMRRSLHVIRRMVVEGSVCSEEDFAEFEERTQTSVARMMDPEAYKLSD